MPSPGRVDYPVSFTLRMKGLQAAYVKRRGGAPVIRELIDQAMAPARPVASPGQPSARLTRGKTPGKRRRPRTV